MELKDMCKEVREKLHITQKKLGEMIGCTQTEVSFIEGGFSPPNKDKIKKLVEVYEKVVEVK